ncbi:MAG: B12-binding domain-containing radical SAM protein [Nitrospirae bacterium]|nr:B12-binding domain-containing radical SAM protein [Nitrospirota bacterium]
MQVKSSGLRITLYDHAYETFAIQYLASTLKKHGFSTEVFFDCSMNKDYLDQDFFLTNVLSLLPDQLARGILDTNPDVVGFSILTVFYPEISKIMRCLKSRKPELIIIAGGPHCILAPSQILENPDIDFIFRGDADISLPMFLNELRSHSIEDIKTFSSERLPGVANMFDGKMIDRGFGPLLENLDEAPFPEKDAYYKKNPSLRLMYTASCSRGCIFTCTYCNSNTLRKIYKECNQNYFRVRSVENVMEELRYVKAKYKPKYIMFLDNLFASRKEWLRKFAEIYKRDINLPFFCETNPNVHTTETIDLLADAGCAIVQFGFQTPNENVRREILHRYETNARITELVKRAKERGIFVCIDHIANLPGETKEHLYEALDFYSGLRPDWINLGFLQYYPRAEIIDIALARKALAEENISSIYRGEGQTSFRLVSKSSLGMFYRTLPFRFFSAFKLPPGLGKRINKLIDSSATFSRLVSSFASVFIYASRIFFAFTDRRDFLVRHHIIRNLYVVRIILMEKYLKYAG